MLERPPRLLELDLLRISAALAVVVFHYTFSGPFHGVLATHFPELDPVTRYGYLGVDLFFTISGFVVLMTAWQRRTRDFIISRIVRLYPAYWLAVTLTALFTLWLGADLFDVNLSQYLWNLTMFQALPDVKNVDVVYWTLWSELRFYALILVLTLIGITRKRVLAALWAWLAACAVLESGIVPDSLHRYADLVVQTYYAHYFIAGMAMYVWYRSGPSWQVGAIVALAFGNAVYRGGQFTGQMRDQYQTYFNPLVVAGVVAMIFTVLALVALGRTRRIARSWFAVAGAITYPLYLIHAHIGFMLLNRFEGHVNRWILVPLMVIGMCGVAYLIQVGVERPAAPAIKRGLTRILYRRNTPKPVAAATGGGQV